MTAYALVFSNSHVCVRLWNRHGPYIFKQAHAGVNPASVTERDCLYAADTFDVKLSFGHARSVKTSVLWQALHGCHDLE
ncbi:g6066 [Coccomyxa viridis]|uniref:G6066 protein n=1 Tax=Coccomyxa viridis TaxID=1274662 RepID=A0ABP1FX19_9CHLO